MNEDAMPVFHQIIFPLVTLLLQVRDLQRNKSPQSLIFFYLAVQGLRSYLWHVGSSSLTRDGHQALRTETVES